MNYHLIPSYLERMTAVKKIVTGSPIKGVPTRKWKFKFMVNLGCGKGDYDNELQPHINVIIGVDINKNDIDTANRLSAHTFHTITDATITKGFASKICDLIICIDTIEHVNDPNALLRNAYRLLDKNGELILTTPVKSFPWTYDPINKLLLALKRKTLPIGAYAFGHDTLPTRKQLTRLLQQNGFAILHEQQLGGPLTSLCEMYWTGLLQRLFKENNTNTDKSRKSILHYTYEKPWWTPISALIIHADQKVSRIIKSKNSIGMLYHCVKLHADEQ